ncbi:hypothetical protein SAMN05192574_11075 [Mucilaginibacter gossypiicola]|uniref:Uncharacterized protein n=1 Tax=Mucilaginibacter gossypiicola TaxID=551995 RepID=A0A1H8RB86_9SPHI|nr:hypothetical protein SAMN05192574_11075 [Mucilaginibacter gossypiicola]
MKLNTEYANFRSAFKFIAVGFNQRLVKIFKNGFILNFEWKGIRLLVANAPFICRVCNSAMMIIFKIFD